CSPYVLTISTRRRATTGPSTIVDLSGSGPRPAQLEHTHGESHEDANGRGRAPGSRLNLRRGICPSKGDVSLLRFVRSRMVTDPSRRNAPVSPENEVQSPKVCEY